MYIYIIKIEKDHITKYKNICSTYNYYSSAILYAIHYAPLYILLYLYLYTILPLFYLISLLISLSIVIYSILI